jgi:enoyl-CoA hydratase/carnithine racemase
MNSLSSQAVQDLSKVWKQVQASEVRGLVIASSNPFLYCTGADGKAFTIAAHSAEDASSQWPPMVGGGDLDAGIHAGKRGFG